MLIAKPFRRSYNKVTRPEAIPGIGSDPGIGSGFLIVGCIGGNSIFDKIFTVISSIQDCFTS